MSKQQKGGRERVAVVLSGAAARGAFQAGVLAELLPAMERADLRPSIVLGTSAGAINAALWGANAHLGADIAAEELVGLWREMSHANVFRPILATSVASGLQFASGAFAGRGGGTTSLLDTEPLQRTADARLDTEQLAANVEAGRPPTVGVIATRVPAASASSIDGTASGRTVVFLHERKRSSFEGDTDRAQDVVRCRLGTEHVLASAAIPIAFPAQRITQPDDAAGWYVDGGIRLNTPLRPAIALGATKLIVVSATSTRYGPAPTPDHCDDAPDMADSGAQAMHAVLADRMVEDLLALQRTNRLVEQVAKASDGARKSVLRRRDRSAYRTVRFIAVSPPAGEMGRLAADVYDTKTNGLGALREADNWLLGRLLRGAGDASGRRELLSYLLFDEDYFAEGIALGRQAAAEVDLAKGWST